MSNESAATNPGPAAEEQRDFIRDIVQQDIATGRCKSVVTRFPPEPNGYLHIGHAKSICLNFGIARQFGGRCNLRMDDTNPTKEDVEYVESITNDVNWLIAGWADQVLGLKAAAKTPDAITSNGKRDVHMVPASAQSAKLEPFYASDYFEQLYAYAVQLIEKGHAYVCDHTSEELERMRGATDRPGIPSQYRDRSVRENLDLFARMRAGEFADGARTLRAKIDMSAPNIWLRDPLLYRIRHASHHHTGDAWCIYPLYDFAHGLSDYIEGITHSICTLEFEVHRPLYDWILQVLDLPRTPPHQYEFARLNVTHTVMSKRKLLRLVQEKLVSGWDDPRLPTIAGMRRRGYPSAALRAFCEKIGVAKRENTIELALLESCVREHWNIHAPRAMAVLRPLRVEIENWPPERVENLDAANHPTDPAAGTRRIPFSRVLYIEQDDFRELPPPKYYRLSPGVEVRLRNAYLIRCTSVEKDAHGVVTGIRAHFDEASGLGNPSDGRKVKATIHWVSAAHALDAEVRLYDTLFTAQSPDDVAEGEDFTRNMNPASLETLAGCKLEPSLTSIAPGATVQFERLGYFCADSIDSRPRKPVFNRTVTLKDAWSRIEQKQTAG